MMRMFLAIILALTVLAACDSENTESQALMATTSTTRARAVERPTTTTTPAPAPHHDPATLQRSVDEGHQPWRSDPEWVADVGAACFFDGPAASVEPAGANRYLATSAATGEQAIVELTQPLGPGTVWLVSDVSDA